MKEFSNKLNGADEYITVLDVIKTENLYNERRRERLFGVSLNDELGTMKDEVSASSFFCAKILSCVIIGICRFTARKSLRKIF